MSTLLILGAGGHGRVVADAALCAGEWQRMVATDRDPARCVGALIEGVQCMALPDALAAPFAIHIAIGHARHREREAAALGTRPLVTVIHPRGAVSPRARVGAGSFVAAQAVVAPGATLGRCAIVNHGAVVDHDVTLGDYVHVAPQAALGGGVSTGHRVLIGSGAVVLPGVRLGDDVIIGAGAVVRSDLLEPGTYAGVPARRLA